MESTYILWYLPASQEYNVAGQSLQHLTWQHELFGLRVDYQTLASAYHRRTPSYINRGGLQRPSGNLSQSKWLYIRRFRDRRSFRMGNQSLLRHNPGVWIWCYREVGASLLNRDYSITMGLKHRIQRRSKEYPPGFCRRHFWLGRSCPGEQWVPALSSQM